MEDEETFYDDYAADQDPSFRHHGNITPSELTSAFNSHELLKGDMHLGLKVNNPTAIDLFIMDTENPNSPRNEGLNGSSLS